MARHSRILRHRLNKSSLYQRMGSYLILGFSFGENMERSTELDLAFLSLAWGRNFDSVIKTHQRANIIVELEERRGKEPVRLFLRLARPDGRTLDEIQFEIDTLKNLQVDPGVAIARPLPGKDGQYIRSFPWDGVDLHTCLFEEAPGRELENTVSDLHLFGRALALLHSAKFAPSAQVKERRIDAVDLCHSTCILLPKHGTAATALATEIQSVAPVLAKALASGSLREGFCHGDSWLQNARLLEEVVTFFDFEECGFGPQTLDLALMVPWIKLAPNGDRLLAALEEGYTEQRPLERDELLKFPALILLSELRRVHSLARFNTMPETHWEAMRLRVTTQIEAFLDGNIVS